MTLHHHCILVTEFCFVLSKSRSAPAPSWIFHLSSHLVQMVNGLQDHNDLAAEQQILSRYLVKQMNTNHMVLIFFAFALPFHSSVLSMFRVLQPQRFGTMGSIRLCKLILATTNPAICSPVPNNLADLRLKQTLAKTVQIDLTSQILKRPLIPF